MQANVIYLIPVLGIFSLIVMAFRSAWVSKQDAGDANMIELSKYIADGAMAFLKAEWKILSYFAVVAAILLGWSGTLVETSDWVIAISFLIGAVLSATAGYIGMKVATKANVRTTQAARTSLQQALKVSFTGGSVMGLGVAADGQERAASARMLPEFLVFAARIGAVIDEFIPFSAILCRWLRARARGVALIGKLGQIARTAPGAGYPHDQCLQGVAPCPFSSMTWPE